VPGALGLGASPTRSSGIPLGLSWSAVAVGAVPACRLHCLSVCAFSDVLPPCDSGRQALQSTSAMEVLGLAAAAAGCCHAGFKSQVSSSPADPVLVNVSPSSVTFLSRRCQSVRVGVPWGVPVPHTSTPPVGSCRSTGEVRGCVAPRVRRGLLRLFVARYFSSVRCVGLQ